MSVWWGDMRGRRARAELQLRGVMVGVQEQRCVMAEEVTGAG